ncbi:NAD(P)-binding protein [Nocardioides marmoribigeumensis]|uniref:NAD(P)/FAD-dependent oxidoreductase n=1 Tax=Nocardioides marmoribigeumensis TaxID=433649 RepID=A0ABU2BV07_9ACTN|nr:NAD(P)-binding protein [Nocardioides marmoribigeumensis]MDR7362469.1 hypothetical protein [Nocardioides marmoribigeumensis]
MSPLVDVDYLVVGAGAMGMAFTDALVDHDPTARVALVDRRDGPGGHWRAAYPFVRLHQASQFYGVASTVLGGTVQTEGPEAGLHERATRNQVCDYYDRVLARLEGTGRVRLFRGAEHDGRRSFHVDGVVHEVPSSCRVVDGRLLSPLVPAEVPAPFGVDGDVRAVAANDVVGVDADRFVVVGSGKTATDTIVWLLRRRGLDPGAITWVRPRDPWMLDRARIQPRPESYLGMVADLLHHALTAPDLPSFFLALEESGTMLRIDPAVTPTMAKAPTLGRWELELLRTVTDVVRLGHVRRACRGRLELDEGSVQVPPDAVVVHCAADGLRNPPMVPIWTDEVITLQPVRAGFPCFGAAITGYVEGTRRRLDDAVKNALCRPSRFGNSLQDWARMNVQGLRNTAAFRAAPDVAAWADGVAINASRVPPDHPGSPQLDEILGRIARDAPAAVQRLEALAG